MANIDDILRKYKAKIASQISTERVVNYSREYKEFKEETMPHLTRFEALCKNIGRSFKIKLKKSDEGRIKRDLEIAHVDITPSDVASLAVLVLISSLFFSLVIGVGIYLMSPENGFPVFFLLVMILFVLFLFSYTINAPARMAQEWRLKASSQMVPCVLYIVVYMRHTSNLERAIRFAAEHLQAPLALDLKKVFWDVEIGKYSTIKDSLDAYLETWRDYAMEFIEAFHLIESSLYETSESRRVATLEKALDVILDGVYEKMLRFTHDVKTPLQNLYMLGIVLPTLALALLPLASTLLQGAIKWNQVMLVFNLLFPFLVFYLANDILRKRPGGYGETELLEQNPDYYIYASKRPYFLAAFICIPLLIISFMPLIFQYTPLPQMMGLQKDFTINMINMDLALFDFKHVGGKTSGPFGLGALLLSLLIPLSLSLFFIMSYNMKTAQLLKTREETKKLEGEFASSLFQLGNRLGDGVPAEIAFGRVAESVHGTATENFFKTVNTNIQQLGMSLETAIFNPKRGAIVYFPSALVRTSMQILIESAKKGLQTAARALMSISDYVKNINKINERLKDLLADIVADMKSNMTFLAPILAGVVIGLSAMITMILAKFQSLIRLSQDQASQAGGIGAIVEMFNVETMIPPYFLQIIVGIYIMEVILILTKTLVMVESGVDELNERAQIAKNLQSGMLLYIIVSFMTIVTLSLLAIVATGGLNV